MRRFSRVFVRVIITAEDDQTLRAAAEDSTSTPSIVIGRVEGGIERYLSENDTPDGRRGAIVQFWGGLDGSKPIQDSIRRFETELSYRIRQDILVKPFTAVFDNLKDSVGRIDTMERIGHCGDGYEWEEEKGGRKMINIPIMIPDFRIERFLGYSMGVMGETFGICAVQRDLFLKQEEKHWNRYAKLRVS